MGDDVAFGFMQDKTGCSLITKSNGLTFYYKFHQLSNGYLT
jgi:hypothetical protein